jgi:hypothetical protein
VSLASEISEGFAAVAARFNALRNGFTFDEQGAAPATPAAGKVVAYVKSADKKIYIKDSTGLETDLTATGGGTSGLTFNTKTADHTLTLDDANDAVELNLALPNTLTIPPNSSVAFPIGTVLYAFQYGTGATTIAGGAGVTVRSLNGNLVLAGQYGWAKLVKRGTDEWTVQIYGSVAGPRELARAVTATAQTGISTVTDLNNLSITFTVDKYAVEVELWLPWTYSSTGLVNGVGTIYDTPGAVNKAQSLFNHPAGGAYAPVRTIERITTPGTYTRKGRIERASGTGTINVSLAGAESTTGGYIKATEVPT